MIPIDDARHAAEQAGFPWDLAREHAQRFATLLEQHRARVSAGAALENQIFRRLLAARVVADGVDWYADTAEEIVRKLSE